MSKRSITPGTHGGWRPNSGRKIGSGDYISSLIREREHVLGEVHQRIDELAGTERDPGKIAIDMVLDPATSERVRAFLVIALMPFVYPRQSAIMVGHVNAPPDSDLAERFRANVEERRRRLIEGELAQADRGEPEQGEAVTLSRTDLGL